MVALLLLTLLQTPTAPAQPPQPAPAAPKPRPAAPASTTTSVSIFVTNESGAPIENVSITASGPVEREVKTPASGPVRIQGLRAGTYRLRFARDGYITFEKELVWRAGTAAPEIAVTLRAAPPPPEPPPAPVAPPPAPAEPVRMLPPPGTPKTMQLADFIDNNIISSKEGHKENIVGCSGDGQAVVWQVREPWDGRQHPAADGMLYIIAGEGTLKLGGSEISLTPGSFAVVPRGTSYGFTRRGRNPLIVLAVLSGAPCAG
jgi:mannose-6-phosphate isomerase-like protein (cupin superfamily)